MVFACITEACYDCWTVEACTDIWESMERVTVFGSYKDAVKVGENLVNKWKWMED